MIASGDGGPAAQPERSVDDLWIYKSAFEAMAVGVALCETDGRIVSVNQRLCDLIGLTREDISAQPYGGQIHFQDEGARAAAIKNIISGAIAEYTAERRYLRPGDGVSFG